MLDTPYSASFLLLLERVWNVTSNQNTISTDSVVDH